MFKFFRRYNKIILVAGGCLLMVAFLVQGTLSSLMRRSANRTIGMIGDHKVTMQDQKAAASQLMILRRLPPVGAMAAGIVAEDSLMWHLLLYDAKRIGLAASDGEVDDILFSTLGMSQTALDRMAVNMKTTTATIRHAVKNWIVVEYYRELMLGQTHKPLTERVRMFAKIYELASQGRIWEASFLQNSNQGPQRLSQELIEHFLQDQQAQVAGKLLLIDADQYLDQIQAPSEQELVDLFEQFKDDLPGQSKPYALGYATPSRVQIRYLGIPLDRCIEAAEVEEDEALEYYQEHKEQLIAKEAAELTDLTADRTTLPATDYLGLRDKVIEQLKREKAIALGDKMIKTAVTMFAKQTQRFEKIEGYRKLPQDFQPLALRVVAEKLTEQFGVKVDVHGLIDQWTNLSELDSLVGIGLSTLSDRPAVRFPEYVKSTRQLQPPDDNDLVSLHLQVGLVSLPLTDTDQTRYLFRLDDAQPQYSPQHLDEVRPQVEVDARRLAAYKLLLSRHEQTLAQALEQGLESLVEQAELSIIDIPFTQRRQFGLFGSMKVPEIAGVGQSEALIEALFQTAKSIDVDNGVQQAPAAQRYGVVGIDNKLSLGVYRIDDYLPMTRSGFDQWMSTGQAAILLNQFLLSDADQASISFEQLAKRLGFVRSGGNEQEDTESDESEPPAQQAAAS